jgi:hypothetical protein
MKMKKLIFQAAVLASALGVVPCASAGPTLWIGDGLGNLGTVGVTTGAQTVIGGMGQVMTDIAFDPSGNLYGITTSALYRINTGTAATTLVGSLGSAVSGSFNALVFDNSGVLYTAAGGGLYTVNPTAGATTLVPGSSCPVSGTCLSSSGDLAFVGGKLYITSDHSGPDSLWQVGTSFMNSSNTFPVAYPSNSDIRTGLTTYANVFGLASPDHTSLYGVDGTQVLLINKSNGTATVLSDYGAPTGLSAANGAAFFTEAGAVAASPVDEPATLATLLVGLGLSGLLARRRKRAA